MANHTGSISDSLIPIGSRSLNTFLSVIPLLGNYISNYTTSPEKQGHLTR